MNFKLSLLAALAASLQFVAAVPKAQIIAPYGTEVTLCTDPNFAGTCTDLFVEHEQCTEFPQQFQNDVSSLSLVQGWSCTLFISHKCNPALGTLNVDWTGDYSQLTYGDDAFNSVICHL